MENNRTPSNTDPHPGLLSFFLLLILAALLGALLGSGLALGIGLGLGLTVPEMTAPPSDTAVIRTFLRLSNLFSHLFTFTVPALVLTALFYRKRTWSFLRLDRVPSGRFLTLGVVWVILSFPFAQLVYWINRQLPLPENLLAMEDSVTRLLEILLHMDGPGELLLNILVVGVVPAIGEELIFRGLLQRRLQDRLPGHLAVWITAIVFSAIHFQFAGFFPRLLLGGLLGYLFLWSHNLWVPIAAHFFFNATQVVAQYLYGDTLKALDMEGPTEPYWLSGSLSLLLLLGLGRYLAAQRNKPEAGANP